MSLQMRPQVEALEARWQPSVLTPTYQVTFTDAVTADNAFVATNGQRYWTIDAGADAYQDEVYERPTAQTYQVRRAAGGAEQFAASEYFANLDVVEGQLGYDDTYLYVSLKMAGLTKNTSDGSSSVEGLAYQYGFRLAQEADGGGGILIVADQPGAKNGTRFGGQGTFIYGDANGDVGGTGLSVTKQDRQAEVNGNGYEWVIASDGRTSNGRQVLWARVSPTDATTVEFALNYRALGFTAHDLQNLGFFQFEANKGLKDPANYNWNDEYTQSEAGSPYRATSGDLRKSEFGTQGLGNIYELDTLRGGPIVVEEGNSSLSGYVTIDQLQGRERTADEIPLAGVVIRLTGINDRGEVVDLTTTTDANGFYIFEGLRAGTYSLAQQQPAGVYIDPNTGGSFPIADGNDHLGSIPGVGEGNFGSVANDLFFGIVLGSNQQGQEYNFTELLGELT